MKMTVRRQGRLLRAAGVLLVGALLPARALAQNEAATGRKNIVTNNLSDYDTRWFHPGFFVAANASRYLPDYTTASVAAARNVRYLTRVRPGFTVGFIGDVRIHEHLTLRFVPGVGFYTREVKREVTGGSFGGLRDTTQQVGNTALELPLLIKFHGKRRGNARLYVIAGAKSSADVGNKKKDRLPNQLRSNSSDLSIEYGVGADLFYPIFKFGPELRISHGLRNLNPTDAKNTFNQALGHFTSHTITLFFNFE
ncbi:MAG: PorT family protein [Hymenobacteraceae bacterium]|nr:PorT family protein [Hymenobacteraceae bacterium]